MTEEIKTCSICGKKVRKDFLDADKVRFCAEHKHLRTSKYVPMSDEEFDKAMEDIVPGFKAQL